MSSSIIIATSIVLGLGLFLLVINLIIVTKDREKDSIREQYKDIIKRLEASYKAELDRKVQLEMKEIDERTSKYSESCRKRVSAERSAAEVMIEQAKKDAETKAKSYEEICSQRIEEAKSKMQEQIDESVSQLTREISIYEEQRDLALSEMENIEKQKLAVIEKFRADEEIRAQRDFYHITIEDSIKSDVEKLKKLGSTLSRPAPLYKFIYEVYYKAKLEELFSRVLGENKSNGGIYKITNINNEKCYIGKTTNFLTRWRTHSKRGLKAEEASMNQLYQFMWEEGIENFSFEIVEVCDKDKQTEREKYWTEFYKSSYYGYNMKVG